MKVTNGLAQIVITKLYSLARHMLTLAYQHLLSNFQVSSYLN